MRKKGIGMRKIFVGCLMAAVLATGCTARLGHFTVVSTKNIDWSRAAELKRASQKVQGSDNALMLIFIPLNGTWMPHLDTAIDNAIETVPGGVALLDAVIHSKFFFTYIINSSGYVIEGTPLIDPTLAAKPLPSNRIYAKMGKDGKISTEYLSEEEYLKRRDSLIARSR